MLIVAGNISHVSKSTQQKQRIESELERMNNLGSKDAKTGQQGSGFVRKDLLNG
jgi:hypothetical protein